MSAHPVMVMTAFPSTPTSDQARRLRSLMDAGPLPVPGRRARVVAVSSGKGGVGKTNLAVNLAIALQRRGVRTTLLDLDLGLANADLLCGLNPPSRLDRAALRDITLEALTVLAPGGFRLVPGSVGLGRPGARAAVGLGAPSEADTSALARLHELDACSDVVILDTGAGMGQLVRSCLAVAELVLLVATPEPTSIADAYALLKVACGGRTCGRGEVGGTGPDAQFVPMLLLN
ncbi:MAG: AAA family ATPase, partial [Phycisphaerales bacterium]|nr:AAA family ATPase [Phycisphaerales bacterium]